MLVGIYMPSGSSQRNAPAAVDGLESDFLRRAIRGVLRAKNRTDARFLWFTEEENKPVDPDIPCECVTRHGTLMNLVRGGHPSLEDALKKNQVDTLLTRLDMPPPGKNIPKVLFTLDMHFCGDVTRNTNIPPPPLPRKIKQICAEAKGILCPSEYVHKACASRLEMGLEKAAVARPGIEEVFSRPQDSIIDGPFALFVLNRYTEPSIPMLQAAIKRNPSLFPPSLVVLGEVHPGEPEDWGIPVVRIERCPDNMTASLLQHATMCLYLSKAEGSGMIVLQAMMAGAMLVTTKSGANFEVAGTAPFYCESDNPFSLLQSLRRMLDESPKEREKRRQMARTLVLDSTWEKCGNKILSVLRRSLI